MKHQYKKFNFRPETLRLIAYVNGLITSYMQQGYTLSVRQLYYQLVARGQVENTLKSYKSIADMVNNGRLAGLIDWAAIEDRNRNIDIRSRWTSGGQILRGSANQFHMDMWEGQERRLYVIVEKAALEGVLGGVCRTYDIPMLAARGYPSVSILRELVLEHFRPAIVNGQRPLILHLGDHDPSGIDMTRDLEERIEMFLEEYDCDYELQRIALNMDQVEEKNPPPNPAKTTDSRYVEYKEKHGEESWELDALEPAYLEELVQGRVRAVIDFDAWDARRLEIEGIRNRLHVVADNFDKEE